MSWELKLWSHFAVNVHWYIIGMILALLGMLYKLLLVEYKTKLQLDFLATDSESLITQVIKKSNSRMNEIERIMESQTTQSSNEDE